MIAVSECKNFVPDKCPITNEPLFMEIEHPDLGWVPTYGGPYDSYTIPELDDDGDFVRYRYDHDEGLWVDGVDTVGNATEIISDLRAKLDKANHIGKTALEDVMRLLQERDDLRAKLEAAQEWINKSADVLEQAEQDRDNLQAKYNILSQKYNEQNTTINKLDKERDNLQAQVEDLKIDNARQYNQMEHLADENGDLIELKNQQIDEIKHLEYQLGEACLKIAEYEHTPLEEVKAWCDGLREGYTDLQAQVGVLQDGIQQALIDLGEANRYARIAEGSHPFWWCYKKLESTLSTTPAEAGERVRGLVEALEVIKTHKTQFDYETVPTKAAIIAATALAKYRGGTMREKP